MGKLKRHLIFRDIGKTPNNESGLWCGQWEDLKSPTKWCSCHLKGKSKLEIIYIDLVASLGQNRKEPCCGQEKLFRFLDNINCIYSKETKEKKLVSGLVFKNQWHFLEQLLSLKWVPKNHTNQQISFKNLWDWRLRDTL